MSRQSVWRVRELASEAFANLRSATGQGALLLAVVVGIAASTQLVDVLEWRKLERELADARVIGDTTFVVLAGQGGGIDADSCVNLQADPAVVASTAVLQRGTVRVLQLGAREVPTVAIDSRSRLVAQVRVGSSATAVAGSLLALPAGRVTTAAGAVLEARTSATIPRSFGLDGSLAVVESLAGVDAPTCMVVLRASASAQSPVRSRLVGSLAASGPPLVVRAPASNGEVDPLGRFESRLGRWMAPCVAVLLAVLAHFVLRSRAGEFSVYRLSGTTRVQLALVLVMELAVTAGAFLSASLGVAALLFLLLGTPVSVGLRAEWLAASTLLLLSSLSAIRWASRSAFAMVQDR